MSGIARSLCFLALAALAVALPVLGDEDWAVIGTRAAIDWIAVSGLNLVVGFAGRFAIGWVALLAVGAEAGTAVAGSGWPAPLALVAAAAAGAACGLLLGLPASRLGRRGFALATLGFAAVVRQAMVLATGGIAVGRPFPAPFDTPWGRYALCAALAACCAAMTANVAASRIGRGLLAIRDAEVAAAASGISKAALLSGVLLFAGAVAGLAGGLLAGVPPAAMPDAVGLDLSALFFAAILLGGRGSVLGPLLATILLAAGAELAAPRIGRAPFLGAALLLGILLLRPGGVAGLLGRMRRPPLPGGPAIVPRPALVAEFLNHTTAQAAIGLAGVVLRIGRTRVLDGLDLVIAPGTVHGLLGPDGSGKTATLDVIGGFRRPGAGTVRLGAHTLPPGLPPMRARLGIARTFEAPCVVGEASLLANVMIGGTVEARASFGEVLLALPRHGRDERVLRDAAMLALRAVGLEHRADAPADRLQPTELRFMEIARALMLRPGFLLLDEPAAGLGPGEAARLGALLAAIARRGTGVLVAADRPPGPILDLCDGVTVLGAGRAVPGTGPDGRRGGPGGG